MNKIPIAMQGRLKDIFSIDNNNYVWIPPWHRLELTFADLLSTPAVSKYLNFYVFQTYKNPRPLPLPPLHPFLSTSNPGNILESPLFTNSMNYILCWIIMHPMHNVINLWSVHCLIYGHSWKDFPIGIGTTFGCWQNKAAKKLFNFSGSFEIIKTWGLSWLFLKIKFFIVK